MLRIVLLVFMSFSFFSFSFFHFLKIVFIIYVLAYVVSSSALDNFSSFFISICSIIVRCNIV